MYFRNFILMGVFLGAAIFFPNYTFAKEAAGQPGPQNSALQPLVSEKIEHPMALEKAVPVTTEKVNKPATNPSTQQTVPIKPVQTLPNKTNRGIEKEVPSLEKNSKAVESAKPPAKVKDTGQTEPAKPNVVTNHVQEVPKSLSSRQADFKVETNSQTSGLNAKFETVDTDTSVLKKGSSSPSIALAQKLYIDEENKTPSNNWETHRDIEFMNNPPQRTQFSGGQSNEQFSPGAGTMSFIAKWFDWDEYVGLNLGQIYTSRQAKYCHQWINAPPSPPPKAAPFFLTFTAYLPTCNDN